MLARVAMAALLLLLLQAQLAASSTQLSQEDQILRLLNLPNGGYNKGARPMPDNGSANVVALSFRVIKLINVDMVKQRITLASAITLSWTDPRLAWHKIAPPELGAVKKIYAPMDWVWTPDIGVKQPVQLQANNIDTVLVEIKSDGEVEARLSFGTTTKCNMQMANFPFDKQECNYTMASRMKPQSLLQLRVTQSDAIRYAIAYLRGNDYCITSIRSRIENLFNDFFEAVVIVSFTRLPLYYVTVLIVPSALILATCIFGFLLPADSGDRLALNVAILLSMSVFLQLAGSITPAQSESVPVLTWYFMVAMSVTTLSTVGSIIVHLCYRRAASEEAVSNRALRLLFLNRLCGWKSKAPPKQDDDVTSWADRVGESASVASSSCVPAGSEWRHIGRVIDRLLIVGAIAASIGVLLLLIVKGSESDFSSCDASKGSSTSEF